MTPTKRNKNARVIKLSTFYATEKQKIQKKCSSIFSSVQCKTSDQQNKATMKSIAIYEKCENIVHRDYFLYKDSYLAASNVISELKVNQKFNQLKINAGKGVSATFIEHNGYVLLDKTIAYSGRKQPDCDGPQGALVKQLVTSTSCGAGLMKRFFNQYRDKNYIVGANIANRKHDMAIFMLRGEQYRFVHYNPNPKSASRVTIEFIHKFGKNSIVSGYNDPDENRDGKCTYLSWMQLLKIFVLHHNPFHLETFPFCKLAKTYIPHERQGQILAIEKAKKQEEGERAAIQHVHTNK